MAKVAPKTEAELIEAIAAAEKPLEIVGAGTKRGLGRPVEADTVLDMSAFSGIVLYEPEELVLEAYAGTPLAEIEAAVAANNQMLAFEPPDWSGLLGGGAGGTLGGVISCNLSGPRRLKAGAARDHVLGVTGVSGRGEAFKAGARVVKNVTGYDLPKLLTGSYGTLAALVTITLKVLPRPESESTLLIDGLDDGKAIAAMALAMQSSCEVSGAAHLPAKTLLRLEGIPPSIAYRRDKLAALLKNCGRMELLEGEASAKQWRAVRDVRLLAGGNRLVWRLSVPPSQGPAAAARISAKLDARWLYDWAGGLVWLDVPYTEDAGEAIVRGAIGEGHATLVRAPEAVRRTVPVLQPQAPALAALTARVKRSFDPRGLLNPGRMYREF